MANRAQGYQKLREPYAGGGSGPTPLNLAEPIGTGTLEETQASVQERATQVANAEIGRGVNPSARTLSMATGEAQAASPIDNVFNLLTLPADLIRLGVLDMIPGGVNPGSQDYDDIISLNKQRMIARHQANPNSEWGRTGEYRGTDQLEDMGWDYAETNQKGPLDEWEGFWRGVTATAFDVFQDPLSFVTGGGAGVARATAVPIAENIVTKGLVQSRKLLIGLGDDALKVSVRESAEKGTSELILKGAEEIQARARVLVQKDGWADNVAGAIDEVSGVAGVDDLTQGIISDMAKVGGEAAEKAAKDGTSLVNNVVPKIETVLGDSTVWADYAGEIGETVAKKQFYRRGEVWNAYTNHVLYHMPEKTPTAMSTIGGLQFAIPFDFTGKSARSFGKLTEISRGSFSRFTRGEKRGLFTKVSQSEKLFKARTWYHDLRNKAGRQQEVMAFRAPGRTAEQQRLRYVEIAALKHAVAMTGSMLNPLAVTVISSNIGRRMNAGIRVIAQGDDEAADEVMRRILTAYGQGAQDITAETFSDIPKIKLDQEAIDSIDKSVKYTWKLQEAGSDAYARFDPVFKAMYENSDRTYTALKIAEGVEKKIEVHREAFDDVIDEFNKFVTDPRNAKKADSQKLTEFVEYLGAKHGITDMSDNDFVQFWDFINSVKAIKSGPGMQALGESAVVRLRKLGTTARVQGFLDEDGVWKLKVVEDWNELAGMNSKLTKLINAYLPAQDQIIDVFETNPANLIEHWMSQIHSAVSERLLSKFMFDSRIAKDPQIKMFHLDEWMNRQARTGATEDSFEMAETLVDLLDGKMAGRVSEDDIKRVLRHKQLKHITVPIGGVPTQVRSTMYYDPAFRRAVNAANIYIETLKTGRPRVAKLLSQLIGGMQASGKTAQQVHSLLHAEMTARYNRHRGQMLKALKDQIEEEFNRMEEVLTLAGRDQEDLQALMDLKAQELVAVDKELAAIDLEVAQATEKTVREAMHKAPNAETQHHVKQKQTRKKNKHSPGDTPVTLGTREEWDKIFQHVPEYRQSKISHLLEVRDSSAEEHKLMLGIEANELRRIEEGIDVIPIRRIERGEEDILFDSGWAIPGEGSFADVWIEYHPAFGGGGRDHRRGGRSLSRVWPEGKKKGSASPDFARAMGFTGKTPKQLDAWWDENFVKIGDGVWKFMGPTPKGAPENFYVLSTPQSIHDPVLTGELAHIWHSKNHWTPEGYDFEDLNVYGLEATGIHSTAEAKLSDEQRAAIARIRARRPGQTKGLRGQEEVRRYVPVMEFYEEELHQRAITLSKEEGITLVEAKDRLRGTEMMADWVEAYDFAIKKKPGFLRRIETTGAPSQAFEPSKARVPEIGSDEYKRRARSDIVDDITGMETLDETKLVEIVVDVDSPNAHRLNQHMAKQNGVEGWEDMSPADLEHTLAYQGLDPVQHFEPEVGQYFPAYDTEASRSAGRRFVYAPDYLAWLHATATDMDLLPVGTPMFSGIDVEHAGYWAVEAAIEELVNAPINRLYPASVGQRLPIGYEQLPWLTPDLEVMVNGGYRDLFASYDQDIDPYLKLLRLRGRNWRPTQEDILAYHEDIPEFRIGEATAVTDRIMDFLSDEQMEGLRVMLAERVPAMEGAYRDVLRQYREHGEPGLHQDSEFWDWLDSNYRGVRENLGRVRQTSAEVQRTASRNIRTQAGVELLRREKELALGPPPRARTRLPSKEVAEYNAKAAAWESTFISGTDPSPEAAWKNFYDKVQGREVHPAFADLVHEYERQVSEIQSPELFELDIIAEVLNMHVLPEDVVNADVTYTLVNVLAENEGNLRDAIALADPIRGSPRRANTMSMTPEDMGVAEDELGPIGQEWKRLREESWVQGVDEEAGRAENYLDGVGVDADAEDFRPKTGDVMRRSPAYSGLKSRPRILIDIVDGDSFVDMDLLEIGPFDHRFFTKWYEPLSSTRDKGIAREVIDAADAAQGSNLPPMSVPVDEGVGELTFNRQTGQVEETGMPARMRSSTGEPLTYRETGAGGQDPSGVDETLADEYGELPRQGLDPRRMYEQEEKGWKGEKVIVTQKGTGDQVNLGFGDQTAEVTVVKFQEHQSRIEEEMRNLSFPDSPLTVAAWHEYSDELITEGDGLFTALTATNRWPEHGLSVAGIDIAQAEKAWAAFKATRHPSFLMDEDLRGAFGYAKGMGELGGGELKTQEEAIKRAMTDVKVTASGPARLTVRRVLESDYASLRNDVDILARAQTRRRTTEVAGASGELYDQLSALDKKRARQERLLRNRPAPIDQAYDPWPEIEPTIPVEPPSPQVAAVSADLEGRLASTNLKTGAVRIDDKVLAADYEAQLPYLRGQVDSDSSRMQAQILDELGVTADELFVLFEARGGVDAYRNFILRHEAYHVRTGAGVDYEHELAATGEALDELLGGQVPVPESSEMVEELAGAATLEKGPGDIKPGRYEVSTKGDRRFSALNARLRGRGDRTIEEVYQMDIKGYPSIKEGKGQPPVNTDLDLEAEYQALWDEWATENPDLITELGALSAGKQLTDMFAPKPHSISQAKALTNILEREGLVTAPASLAAPPAPAKALTFQGPGVTRVISGGQDGADILGLMAGQRLGLETGGYMPKDAWTEHGSDVDRMIDFGMVEDPTPIPIDKATMDVDPITRKRIEGTGKINRGDAYRTRTQRNVMESDGTIMFTVPGRGDSPGARVTRQAADSMGKPFLHNPTPAQVRDWVQENGIKTLNIAGNREYEDIDYIEAILRAASGAQPGSPSGMSIAGSVGPSKHGTEVVNVKKGAEAQVNIMRSGDDNGLWGNPYTDRADLAKSQNLTLVDTVEEAVEMYEEHLLNMLATGKVTKQKVASLSGKTLGCVDAPGPCHGDVLVRYADAFAEELGQTSASIPAAYNVGRGGTGGGKYGSPFYLLSDRGAKQRWANKVHPWYRRRRIKKQTGQLQLTITDTETRERGMVRPTQTPDETVWEPVPYQAFRSQAEADEAYYNMLWDMLEDPEYGELARRELVEDLHGRLLFRYVTGNEDFRLSKVTDTRILADAVDWVATGVFDASRDTKFMGIGPKRLSGRPTKNNTYPYATHQEVKTLQRVRDAINLDAVKEMYDRHGMRIQPAQVKDLAIQEERLVQQAVENPDWLDQLLAPPLEAGQNVLPYQRAMSMEEYSRQVKAMAQEIGPFLEDMGITEYHEMLTNLDSAWKASEGSPMETILTQAARRTHGPRAVLERRPQGGYTLAMPGSEQNAFLNFFDTLEVNAEHGWDSNDPMALSLAFKGLDDMGEEAAHEKGMPFAYDLSQASQSLRNKRDALLVEIDRLKPGMTDTPTAAAVASRKTAEAKVTQIEEDLDTLHKVMDKAWRVSIDGDNADLRRRFRMANKQGDLPSGVEWEAYQRALTQLQPQHRNNVDFLVWSGLAADLFDSFDDFKVWWFDHRSITRKVSQAMDGMLGNLYRRAEKEPLMWDQVLSMDGIEHKIREYLLDAVQLLGAHQGRLDGGRYSELIHKIGLVTERTVDSRVGANATIAGDRKTGPELVEAMMDALNEIRHSSPLQILADLNVEGINHDFLKRIDQVIESFKMRREEFVHFQKGVPGSYVGLAGSIENGFMDKVVQMEFYRALGRLQLASDPRVGMEVMAGVQKVKRWWTKAATVGRPTFAPRNLIGGLWNNLLDGIPVHKTLAMMPDVWRYVRNRRRLGRMDMWNLDMEDVIDGFLLDGVSAENKHVMGQAIRAGIMDSAFTSTLPRNVKGAYGFQAWNVFNGDNKFFEYGTEAMEFTEGILRMAAFKHYYDEAFPHLTSRMGKIMVDQLHFDYADMSAFDKKMKAIAPFWIWTSRNLPLQMRHMLGDPRMLVRYEHARRNWNDQFRDWEDENGEWQTRGGRWILPFRKEDDQGNWVQLSWEPSLPFADLLATPAFQQTFDDEGPDIFGEGALNAGRWVGWITGNLTPEISALSELAIDPRDQYKTTNAPTMFAPIFRALGAESTPQGDVRVNPWVNSVITTAMPFFNEYTGIAGMTTSSPYSAGNQGFLPGEYMERGFVDARVPLQTVGRGLGLHWRSPEDVYWMYKDMEAYLEQEYFMERSARS